MKRRSNKVTSKAKRKRKGPSNYAKKRSYLAKNGGMGFDYPEPKPWKG